MMTQQRLQAERQALSQFLPPNAYRFMDMDTDFPYVLMAVKTNRGNVYTLRVDLCYFPDEVPDVFVTRMLKDRYGQKMDSVSADMHTLESRYGYTAICHYGYDSWTPRVSLAKVYVKCRLWLEMYELHLQTGNEIDYYLNHMC